jgi:hypothetical protein
MVLERGISNLELESFKCRVQLRSNAVAANLILRCWLALVFLLLIRV